MGVFENAIISEDEILKYIPQRDPMVMIDRFYGIHEGCSYSSMLVRADNLFCENGMLTESGIIEHIAQSAAIRSGYEHISRNETVPVGFIGSVSKLQLFSLPSVGSELQTILRIEAEMMNIILISAQTEANGQPVAACQMKIALQK